MIDSAPAPAPLQWIWRRSLAHYPNAGPRYTYLAITVLATIMLYYELYVQGAVATKIIYGFGFSFTQFVLMIAASNLVGAFGSLAAGLADRWGRANLVAGGLFVTAALVLFGLPNAPDKQSYVVMLCALGIVEGIMLVATPALIRDFSPQLGRASAMAFWAMGPVLGSLVVTEISSHTLDAHPRWQFQFTVCGIAGFVVAVIAFFGLRELSPQLRDQLMVSVRDRELIEARAAGIDPEDALRHQWRQLLKADVIGPALGISLFLFFYYIAVAFFVVYFETVFGFSEARANALANWYWGANALALLIAGPVSDRIRVRKPFMVLGVVINVCATAVFAAMATHSGTTYYQLATVMALSAIGLGVGYAAWMAGFTETVERRNPAATATGLAIFGWIVRIVVTVSLASFTLVVTGVSTLVDDGPRVQAIAAAHPAQLATLQAVDPATLAALQQSPTDRAAGAAAVGQLIKAGLAADPAAAVARLTQLQTDPVPPADLAYLKEHAGPVQQAQHDNPRQWQRWWWVCVVAQLMFLPTIFLVKGRWSPKLAAADTAAHEAEVAAGIAALHAEAAADDAGAASPDTDDEAGAAEQSGADDEADADDEAGAVEESGVDDEAGADDEADAVEESGAAEVVDVAAEPVAAEVVGAAVELGAAEDAGAASESGAVEGAGESGGAG
ncbi:MFS transporter [Nocardia stercoris]|uniref:MFS transporter n=1 Tax=Nocardia stercoris TaxID=2483361 RepID=UPI001F3FBC44|nr:MFS transporter [Nocardia stercoris]